MEHQPKYKVYVNYLLPFNWYHAGYEVYAYEMTGKYRINKDASHIQIEFKVTLRKRRWLFSDVYETIHEWVSEYAIAFLPLGEEYTNAN